jgi:hypothetical protein
MMLPMLESVRVYQDELIREAEAERLVLEALAERHQAGHSPIAWIGRRMIELGNSLVEISGDKADGAEERATISLN